MGGHAVFNIPYTQITQQEYTEGRGGAPSFVGNIDNSAMYDPAKLAGLSTDYVATPATTRRKGKLTE